MNSSTMLLLQLSLHLWTLSCGKTCTNTASAVPSSCSRSKPCRADHPLEDVECAPYPVLLPDPSPLPTGITRCPVRWGGCKYPTEDSNETLAPGSGNFSVFLDLHSTDYGHFAVNVSWSHPHNYSGGYEVRVKDDSYLVQCYCVSDNKNNIFIDGQLEYSPFSYHSNLDVEVILLTDALPKNSTTVGAQVKWPHSCLDIQHNNTTCGLTCVWPSIRSGSLQVFVKVK